MRSRGVEQQIGPALLGWYDAHRRALPWRAAPGERPDPYKVWLSEVMLQQTTTAAAAPYFRRFVERWPTVERLAAAPDAELMAAWAGLGYYARARNLLACARVVAGKWGGRFPAEESELRSLPGVGDYTAAAIAAIAFGRRAVVVDANVERVVARLFAVEAPLPAARPAIRTGADSITPDERAGDFAQAMMDLGATICTVRSPRCLLCPLAFACKARAEGAPERFPLKAPKRARPLRHGTAWWIERGGAVWLVTRANRGMLGGMRALPDDGWRAGADGSGDAPLAVSFAGMGVVEHGFTHFDLRLEVRACSLPAGAAGPAEGQDSGAWWPIERLGEAGLPTLFARAAALAQRRQEAA